MRSCGSGCSPLDLWAFDLCGDHGHRFTYARLILRLSSGTKPSPCSVSPPGCVVCHRRLGGIMKRDRLTPFWASAIFSLLAFFSLPLFVLASHAASHDDLLVDALVNNLTHPSLHIRGEALKTLEELKNPAAVPALIELLRFNTLLGISPVPTLEHLTGAQLGDDWPKWVEWLQH